MSAPTGGPFITERDKTGQERVILLNTTETDILLNG